MSSYWGQIPDPLAMRYNNSHKDTPGIKYTGKVSRGNMRQLTDPATGKPYEVPDDDYRQYLGIGRQGKSINNYIADAFGPTAKINAVEPRATGGDPGHIIKLEYSEMYKILRVTFKKPSKGGQVVAYMNVPVPVAGELLYLAEANPTQVSANSGSIRHVLGMRFWDLIRIRGTIHGSRYPFDYVTDMGNGRDSYAKGTATPDWSKTNFVLVRSPGGGKLEPKAVEQLSDKERSEYEARVALSERSKDKEAGYNVDTMYKIVNKENIPESAKKSILKEMDSMRGRSDAGISIYNYLRNMGLL